MDATIARNSVKVMQIIHFIFIKQPYLECTDRLLTLTASEPCKRFCIRGAVLTMSLLSMPTFRRLVETELMSFSESQDLKSFTAKHAETPEQMHKDVSQLLLTDLPG